MLLRALLLLSLFTPSAHATAPGVAGTLSLVPGLGQASNGDFFEGMGWFTVVVGGMVFSSRSAWPATAFFDLWMYNMYDAYRDAGAKRSAKYNVFENYIAAFNPLNLIDPIGAPIVGTRIALRASGPQIGPSQKAAVPFAMAFVALGEEGLFRGFLFPGLSDVFSSELIGGVTSSLIFAAAHAGYQGQSRYAFYPAVFASRTILGMLWCWQTARANYDLRKSIFSHAWWDIIYEFKRAGGEIGGASSQQEQGSPEFDSVMLKWSVAL